MSHGYISDKDRYSARLRRIEGQIRGLERMVENDVYCIDILTQVAAAQAALRKVALSLLDDHIAHCLGVEEETKLEEVSQAIARLTR